MAGVTWLAGTRGGLAVYSVQLRSRNKVGANSVAECVSSEWREKDMSSLPVYHVHLCFSQGQYSGK
jgi:hypothetical protein